MDGVFAHNLFHRVGDLRNGTDVLRDVSLEAPAGAVTAVVGPAGAGKTSLLHILAGLDRPTAGTVVLDGRPLRGLDDIELTRLRRDRIGLLLPAASVLPTITVRENVALPLLIARRPPAPETVEALLERVGLSEQRDYRPGQLTAAERQRAALARALVGSPTVLLADEPASDLEPEQGARLLMLLREIAVEDNITVVLFTRDVDDAAGVADRIVTLDAGRVVQAAAPLAA
ncbi:MAG TPA: ATP-binding cassette domain-containing protein [Solirubrobacteraceae bacterium]|nr:ATP-binding cassette domain-containing protein [Solirubrobacteraceae bacterium]